MVVSWYLLSPSLILLTAVCLLKGNKASSPCIFYDHTTGGQCSKNLKQTCCMRSQSHARLWPLLKLKLGNCWLTSKCCGSNCKKFNSGFQFQFQSFQFQFRFQFTNFNSNSGIGIGIELQFQFRNWIDPNPATCPHNTPHIPSCYDNEQTTKQTKAINNTYRYISHVNVTQTVPEISPLMPMHQDPLLVTSYATFHVL